jgi:hypothetical protein
MDYIRSLPSGSLALVPHCESIVQLPQSKFRVLIKPFDLSRRLPFLDGNLSMDCRKSKLLRCFTWSSERIILVNILENSW